MVFDVDGNECRKYNSELHENNEIAKYKIHRNGIKFGYKGEFPTQAKRKFQRAQQRQQEEQRQQSAAAPRHGKEFLFGSAK